MGPFFQKLPYSQKEHNRTSRIKIPSQNRHGNGRGVQHLHLKLPPEQTADSLQQIPDGVDCRIDGPGRRRQEGLGKRPHHYLLNQLFLVFTVQGPAAVLRHQLPNRSLS